MSRYSCGGREIELGVLRSKPGERHSSHLPGGELRLEDRIRRGTCKFRRCNEWTDSIKTRVPLVQVLFLLLLSIRGHSFTSCLSHTLPSHLHFNIPSAGPSLSLKTFSYLIYCHLQHSQIFQYALLNHPFSLGRHRLCCSNVSLQWEKGVGDGSRIHLKLYPVREDRSTLQTSRLTRTSTITKIRTRTTIWI